MWDECSHSLLGRKRDAHSSILYLGASVLYILMYMYDTCRYVCGLATTAASQRHEFSYSVTTSMSNSSKWSGKTRDGVTRKSLLTPESVRTKLWSYKAGLVCCFPLSCRLHHSCSPFIAKASKACTVCTLQKRAIAPSDHPPCAPPQGTFGRGDYVDGCRPPCRLRINFITRCEVFSPYLICMEYLRSRCG
jgi:hypothetical protein